MSIQYYVHYQPFGLQRICCRTSILKYVSFLHLREEEKTMRVMLDAELMGTSGWPPLRVGSVRSPQWASVVA